MHCNSFGQFHKMTSLGLRKHVQEKHQWTTIYGTQKAICELPALVDLVYVPNSRYS